MTYPIITSEPDGPYFARPVDPDEDYEFPWVVIHEPTAEHVATGTEETARVVVDTLNDRSAK